MKRRKYPYTAISFVLIAMVLFVLFMVSDILYEERNNLTLLKAALTTEFNGKGYYDGVSKYGFMATQTDDGQGKFLGYMRVLGYELQLEDDHQYYYISKYGDPVMVEQAEFLGRYNLWYFNY